MIELIPAIDIIGGECVRLTKGDYESKKIYSSSPVDMARQFEDYGFKRLHIVDLDGARSKHVVNIGVLEKITATTGLTVDFGGGIKTGEDMRRVFDAGASMVTVGSVAVTSPDLLMEWLGTYGADRIILGADVRKGKISINGWHEDSDFALTDFIGRYTEAGVTNVLCTEISRDGTLTGPDVALYKEVLEAFPRLNLIASGGVSTAEDIRRLDREGVPAVVFGKAFYEGRIKPEELWDLLNV
ncbi:MAG: 1-(5-phosphoribosyl)-5-[(5-phosphoribosylamino)methylideneamino]imidazole-4-carboxamide isomerase [Prevotella sp.]|nr:1-(5-phosphoribosyl)-5-[(5-phosphoribosylamino)methylideneamino]imidazole-4-carboxamide isomerase [Prevotella sp.]